MPHSLAPQCMFRGKNLPLFLRAYRPLYAGLLDAYGQEKVKQVYDYFFGMLSRMQWGQWIVLEKACPELSHRQLFYWVMEMIYNSDLLSQFRWAKHPMSGTDKVEMRIIIVEPSQEQKQRWAPMLGSQRNYLYIDWYSRLLLNPECHPGILPEWLCLTPNAGWGDVNRMNNEAGEEDETL